MSRGRSLTGTLAMACTDVIRSVDASIGENRTYGAGIGPHDEDDQLDALVTAVRDEALVDASVATVTSDPATVRYPNGQSADLVLETSDRTEYCEAKLVRVQKADGNPSSRGYSKVFNPFQDRNPRSFIHDVSKLAGAEIRAAKTLLGIYYRPVEGAGTEIAGETIAQKFASDVAHWTDHELAVDTVAPFDGLQHDVHQRGSIIVWSLCNQPTQSV